MTENANMIQQNEMYNFLMAYGRYEKTKGIINDFPIIPNDLESTTQPLDDVFYKLKYDVSKSTNLDYNSTNSMPHNTGGNDMDNNDILSKYMDKVDQDRRDSESRNEKRISDLEERMDNRLNRIEDNIKYYTESVAINISTLDSKMETKISSLETKLDNKLTLLEGKIDNNNKFILGIAISTIIGIAAIVVSVLISA